MNIAKKLRDDTGAASISANKHRDLLAHPGRDGHLVQFYEDDTFRCDAVANFLGAGLASAEGVLVIATKAHREALLRRLGARSFDVAHALASGHLTMRDASETLATFMVGNMPDWERFKVHLGGEIELARRASIRVRAYGEMVDLLWKDNKPAAAIRLEAMWNDLAKLHSFSLLCAYVMGNFYKERHSDAFTKLCQAHTNVFPTDSYSALENEDARLLEIGALQQRARALQTEIDDRNELEQKLREALDAQAAIVRELETANRMKDEFLATVSHELRTPLNAILGWVRMLRSGVLPEDRRERGLETIERNANAQTQLIEDLLDVSRIISGKLRLEIRGVSLTSVIDNAMEAVRPAANARGVLLRTPPDAGEVAIHGDGDRLQQVVWNLLTNAVKFTPRGGTVRIDLRRCEAHVEVVVTDDGQGIEPAFLPHVFERFRQADATTTRKQGGLGLGLAIVRHLVELHGGSVRVESDGLEKGATFTVCLPLAPPRSTAVDRPPPLTLVPSPELPCPKELEGLHVLILDDEADARELLAELLSSCKALPTTARTVDEALDIVQRKRPDVVVSDIGMPGEDGYALIAKLRALPPHLGGRTPAVALTAYARFEDRTKALVAGFNLHVPKPVEPTELLAVLASLAALLTKGSAGFT